MCTGIIVGGDLTEDGSTYFGRTEDLEVNHNKVYVVHEAGEYKNGSKIIDVSMLEEGGYEYLMTKDSYQFTSVSDTTPEYGKYDEAGFNDNGLIVDMTVSASYRDEIEAIDPLLENGITEAIMPTVVLSNCSNAEEAIKFIATEVATKGSAEGNGLVVADSNDLWYMEIYSGHQFVAMRYPSDKFSVFPNTFWLNETKLDLGAEEEHYNVSVDGNFVYSKDIFKVAKDAGTFKGDEDARIIDLAGSYAPEELRDSNRSRAYSGIKHVNPNSTVTAEDKYYDFLQDAPAGSVNLNTIMTFTQNRLENIGLVADDLGKGELYPVGNRNTMEAHIFQVNDNMSQEYPGIMWLAIGSPLISPYVPYYPNQTTGIPEAKNQNNDFNEESVYWITMDILHMVETNRDEFMEVVKAKMNPVQQEIIAAALTSPATPEEATENNHMLANKALKALVELREELIPLYEKYLAENDYVANFKARYSTAMFAGSKAAVEKGTSSKKLMLKISPTKGTIMLTDVYGNEVSELAKDVTYSLPKTAITNPIFRDMNNNTIPFEEEGDFYIVKTSKPIFKYMNKVDYNIIEGSDQKWNVENKEGLTFVSDAAHELFVDVMIDGKVIDAKNYEVTSGSTKVTVKADYLKTLATTEDKEHTFTIDSIDGQATTTFVIEKTVKDANLPDTGDNGYLLTVAGVIALVGAGYILVHNIKETN